MKISINPDPAGEPRPVIRVGMVSSFMPPHLGGLEVAARGIFEAYVAAGCEVLWVASRVPEEAMAREDRRVRVGCWNGLERWFGVPWPVWGPVGVRELIRLTLWADILHVHDCLYFTSALALLFALLRKKPVLLSQHIGFVQYGSPILNGLERLAYNTLGRAVLQGVSHIVFCTPGAEKFITGLLGERPEKASTIPYGIDIDRFHPPSLIERTEAQRSLGLPERERVVLFAGRLVEKKGIGLFLKVCQQMSSYHFLLVGDGPLRPSEKVNLTWIPFIPPERMEMVYRAADVFLMPSHGEGFPMAVLEAMATGVPVIAPRGEAFTALLEHEEACLSAELTSTALCEALVRLWETPGLAAVIAARSRELVMRDYTIKTMGARYLALIRSLAGRN